MTPEESKADCLARLAALRRQVEDGTITCIAYAGTGSSLVWSYSGYPLARDGLLLVAGLEATKHDLLESILTRHENAEGGDRRVVIPAASGGRGGAGTPSPPGGGGGPTW